MSLYDGRGVCRNEVEGSRKAKFVTAAYKSVPTLLKSLRKEFSDSYGQKIVIVA